MRKMFWTSALIGALVASPAIADDGSASLAAGGIVFVKNTAIRMAVEDLYISPKLVRVRFEFVNDTNKDVETLVAFPLPDIDNEQFYFEPLGATADDPENFVGFKASVDGKRIATQVEQRAFIKNRDVTSAVRAAGLPLNVVIGGNAKTLDALPEAKRKQLIAQGVLADDTPSPLWTVRTKFHWTQRFPAHKTVVIEHTYHPVVGTWNTADAVVDDRNLVRQFCVGPMTKAYVTLLDHAGAIETGYILKTANSWNGPIGRFHLTLDKLKPGNVLSLCWDGKLKKTGSTTFEDTRLNFAPARDIHMLVLE